VVRKIVRLALPGRRTAPPAAKAPVAPVAPDRELALVA
jgi:hypothetical protein